MKDLCQLCKQADNTCPVYARGVLVYKCVEWKPIEGIKMNDFVRLSTQNIKEL
jgi:hypothetical protein